jgi:glycine cleavage system regulatory protein
MQQQYVITFAGADRTGLVETLADMVAAHGGDWQQSELTRLGGAFAGAVLVNVSAEGLAELKRDIESHNGEGLSVGLTAVKSSPTLEPNLYLTLTGPNRPGIVYEVTHELSDSDINILNFSSSVENAAWSGGDLFIAELAVRAPDSLDVPDLRERLDQIENKMTLEIDIEPADP